MSQKFVIEFEHDGDMWFVKSRELNCFIFHRDLKKIVEDIPQIVEMVTARKPDQ